MRQQILDQVQRGLRAILSRRIGVCLGVWGEAGIGKTYAAADVLRGLPCDSLSVHATTPTSSIPDLPRPRSLPDWAMQQLDRLRSGQELSLQVKVDTLSTTLAALAPFALHIEDWHEANPEQQEVVVALAKALKRTPGVGLLVTGRAALPAPFVNYGLPALTAEETAHLTQTTLGAVLPVASLHWLQERTGGNPLFALEFSRYLVRQGFLWRDGQDWHWRTPPIDFVPASVEALIEALLTQSAEQPTVRAVLEARAILPADLVPEALQYCWGAAADCTAEALAQASEHLRRAGIFQGEGFSHPLYGEVVTARLGERVREYAGRALDALETRWPEQAATLLEQAIPEPRQALEVLAKAAKAAEHRGAAAQRAQWLARSVAYLPVIERPQRALAAAEALHAVGLSQAALSQAEIAATTLPQGVRLCAELLVVQGQVTAAEARLKTLTEQLSPEYWWQVSLFHHSMRGLFGKLVQLWETQPVWQAATSVDLQRRVGNAYAVTGNVTEAERLAQTLLTRLDLTPTERLDIRNLHGHLLHIRTDPQSLEYERETIALARQAGLVQHLGMALVNHAMTLNSLNQPAAVRPLLLEAAHIFRQLGLTLNYARCQMRLADLAVGDGLFEEAEILLTETHALVRRYDNGHLLTESHLKQARLYLDWQPPHGAPLALRHAQAALESTRASQDHKFLRIALCRAAQAEACSGHARVALPLAQEALELAHRTGDPQALAQAQVACALALEADGQRDVARAQLDQAYWGFLHLNLRKEAELCGLETDRLDRDLERARTRRDWLLASGFPGKASLAERYFPELVRPTLPGEPAPPVHATVRINVLGSPMLEREGQAIMYRGRKRWELLAYLLEARISGRPEVGLLELLDTFFAGESETRAKNTLKQQVFLIRAALGPSSLLSTAGGYALGAVESDAEVFLQTGDIAHWRGPYLDGLSDGWLPGVRDALSQALRSGVETRLDTDPHAAARLAHILGLMEPFEMLALELEVRALQACGQTAAAQTIYRERRAALLEVGEVLPEWPILFTALAEKRSDQPSAVESDSA